MVHDVDMLRRFRAALATVYGPLVRDAALPPSQAEAWNPPTSPGAGGHLGRYLWTDAFGLVNLVTLSREASPSPSSPASPTLLALAKRLARAVHDTLGRTRDGTSRLLGATDAEPLRGGLRIGKPDATGPDADGQYHHYLTLWMFALNRLSLAADEPAWNDLAVQLARAVHPAFVRRRGPDGAGRPAMAWKLSTDLRRVLVASEGHLDAATGRAVYALLQRTAAAQGRPRRLLARELLDYARLVRRPGRAALRPGHDPLDLGMGLWAAELAAGDDDDDGDDGDGGNGGDDAWAPLFRDEALRQAHDMLDPESPLSRRSASQRLAFRELGMCLGVACAGAHASEELRQRARALVDFWGEQREHGLESGGDLRPISSVMYAAALVPGGTPRHPTAPAPWPAARALTMPLIAKAFCRGYLDEGAADD